MKVVLVHNAYRQAGGEDRAVADELRLLREHGHEVRLYRRDSDEIAHQPPWRSAAEALWSRRSHQELLAMLDDDRPDVVHLHNTFPLVSPSVIWAAAARRVATVATLHNVRLACLEGTFQRRGAVCQHCLGRSPWRGVVRGCYRGSVAQSAVLGASLVLHRALGSWHRRVHRFIALAHRSVPWFAAAGLPAARIRVRPNFAWPAPSPATDTAPRLGGLFVGRLAPEKGIATLADALRRAPGVPFTVVGDGPERARLAGTQAQLAGTLPADGVRARMQRAAFLVLPSQTLEQFPKVLAEAYACGLPVLASRLGAPDDLVEPGVTGRVFEAGDDAGLAALLHWAAAHPGPLAAMGEAARRRWHEVYSPGAAHRALETIYREAMDAAAAAPLEAAP